MSELDVKYPSANVKIIIENGIVNNEWSFLNREFRYIVITDTNLTKFYAKLLSTIPNLETILAIKPGEKAKSISVYEKIIQSLVKLKITKNDVIIAFGGGVVGDLTGFVASTYLRGVKYIQIPTSLVSQVNSSIGGKCGIDIIDKNSIGSFYHPINIIIDPQLLRTLPNNEFENGISEIIKYAMIKDEKMYQEILNNEITANYENLIGLIKRCINIKIALGLKAELNYDSNNLLNYGLLYGNIIDRLSNSKLSYGRMIATGMYYELQNLDLKNSFKTILAKYHLDSDLSKWNIDYLKYLSQDKSSYVCVNIDKIGKAKLNNHKLDI